MDMDSIAMIVSLIGIGLVSLWAEFAARAIIANRPATLVRVSAVVVVGLLILAVVAVGPWIAMSAWHGILHRNLADTNLLLASLIMFGPAVILQIGCAIYFALRGNAST